jgi:hypothetical protein
MQQESRERRGSGQSRASRASRHSARSGERGERRKSLGPDGRPRRLRASDLELEEQVRRREEERWAGQQQGYGVGQAL